MEKRIELEKRGRQPNQITELNLDNCRSTNIVGLTDEFTALESLSLINVGLTSLKGFPKLPNLKKLELSDNRISNGLSNLSASTKITHLNLSGNKIKDLEELKPLESFKELEVLDLFNNEATSIDSYRQKIFAMIPSLIYLDGFDVNDQEAVSDGEDDEEINGNDSDDDGDEDFSKPFCINGLEIDLNELELYEKQLADKRKSKTDASTASTSASLAANQPSVDDEKVDDLDEYLDRLAIEIKSRDNSEQFDRAISEPTQTATANSTETVQQNQIVQTSHNDEKRKTAESTTNSIGDQTSQEFSQNTSFALLLLGFLSILAFVNRVHYGGEDEEDGDDDGDDFEEEEDASENGDASLADIYNEDLEHDDDNSDYVQDGEGASESDLDEEEDDEEEESPARGTKRKHEGEEDDNDG